MHKIVSYGNKPAMTCANCKTQHNELFYAHLYVWEISLHIKFYLCRNCSDTLEEEHAENRGTWNYSYTSKWSAKVIDTPWETGMGDVRGWAKKNGIAIKDTGKIPNRAHDAYREHYTRLYHELYAKKGD